MKKMLKKMLGTVLAVAIVAGTIVFPGMTASAAEATVVFSDNFDSYADMTEGVYTSGTANQDETVALSPNNHTWDSTKWFYNYERSGKIGDSVYGGARIADGVMEIRRKSRYSSGGLNAGASLRLADANASVGKNKYVVQFDMANNINPAVRSGDEADVGEVAFVFSAQKGSSTVNFAYGATQFDLFKVKQTGKLYVMSYDDTKGKTETETNVTIADSTTDFKSFRVEFDATTYDDGSVSWKVYVDGVLAGTGSDTRTSGTRLTNGLPQGFAFGSFIPEDDPANDPTVVLTGTDPKNSSYIDNVIVVKATDADNSWFDTGVKDDAYFVASKTAAHGLTDGSAVSIEQMQTGRSFSGTVEVIDPFTVKINHNFASNPVGGNYTLTFADGSTVVCARNAVAVTYAEEVFSDSFDSYADMAAGVYSSGTKGVDTDAILSPYNHTWDEAKWFYNYERSARVGNDANGGARIADGVMEIIRKQKYQNDAYNVGASLRIAEANASIGKNKYVIQFDMANNIAPTSTVTAVDLNEVAFVFSGQKGASTVNFRYNATLFDMFKVKADNKLYVISYDDTNGRTETATNVTITDSTNSFKTFRVELDCTTQPEGVVSWKVYVDGVLAGTGSDTRTSGGLPTNLPQGFAFTSYIPNRTDANDTVQLKAASFNSSYIDNVSVMKTTDATGATWFDTGAKNDGYFKVSNTIAHGAANGEAVAIVSEQTGKSYAGTVEVVDPYTVKVNHTFASSPIGGNYTLTFADGTSVVCERKGISGTVTAANNVASLTYKNTGASDVSTYLFYAVYNGSALADVKMKEVTLTAGTGAVDAPYSACTVTVPAANTTSGTASTDASTVSADGKTVKAFFWAKSNIAPLFTAK